MGYWRYENKKRDNQRLHLGSEISINLLRSVVPPDQLDFIRSRLALLLSTDLDPNRQFLWAQTTYSIALSETHKLRIVAGKYRLSSQHEKVPVTLINDFDGPVKVSLRFTPLNSRIKVADIKKITIAPKSTLQLSVPFTVIASGTAGCSGSIHQFARHACCRICSTLFEFVSYQSSGCLVHNRCGNPSLSRCNRAKYSQNQAK